MVISIAILAKNGYHVLGIRLIKKFLYHYNGSSNIKFYIFCNEDPYPYLSDKEASHVIPVYDKCNTWVVGANSKFENIYSLRNILSNYIFYMDADTNINIPFDEKWFIGDTVVAEHFDNRIGMKDFKPYDNFIKSSCYVDPFSPLEQQYYQGAFFGGKKQNIINMCQYIIDLQKQNKNIKHEPIWNDESYTNFYFHHHPPKKMIMIEDFRFAISDKGGIEGLRNPKINLDFLKKRMLKNKKKIYDICNGRIANII